MPQRLHLHRLMINRLTDLPSLDISTLSQISSHHRSAITNLPSLDDQSDRMNF
ncbi:hypothetical protein HanXRQr2_Chr14g0669981 [Helianthus annuus]|uniref:Uncharacterized protein n=1 Tax=Helianthus annuus TaxID=4232 RepID=A0A9K3EF00_HELAN|nr:hypothetical protein HanXRQr2_Chr14g0669981 [Helianthus annuus]